LRGVYITSGTQEGTPIDRMLGALAKTFRLAVQPVVATPGRGKAYFIGRLLSEVIFREAGLAGTDPKVERHAAILFAAVYLGTAILTALIVIAIVMSYHANSAYLEEVAAAARPLAVIPSPGSSSTLEASVPSLDAVRQVVDTARKFEGHVPLGMRFGLYQGAAMTSTSEDAYFREMNNSLNPAVARHFEGRIQAAGEQLINCTNISRRTSCSVSPRSASTLRRYSSSRGLNGRAHLRMRRRLLSGWRPISMPLRIDRIGFSRRRPTRHSSSAHAPLCNRHPAVVDLFAGPAFVRG